MPELLLRPDPLLLRAELLRVLLAHAPEGGAAPEVLLDELNAVEVAANREPLTEKNVRSLLKELESEGFCRLLDGRWTV